MSDYRNLGYVNGWEINPVEYMECIKAGHQRREENIGKCQTQIFCDICKITWKIDSGD